MHVCKTKNREVKKCLHHQTKQSKLLILKCFSWSFKVKSFARKKKQWRKKCLHQQTKQNKLLILKCFSWSIKVKNFARKKQTVTKFNLREKLTGKILAIICIVEQIVYSDKISTKNETERIFCNENASRMNAMIHLLIIGTKLIYIIFTIEKKKASHASK